MSVITRFAPSPTGRLHIGSVRTALFSWLYARHHNGKFLLRIEDTDQARSTPEATALILNSMEWLGLTPDEPPIFQSARTKKYRAVADRLVADGKAYHCECTPERLGNLRMDQQRAGMKPKYDLHCRDLNVKASLDVPTVIRFKNPTAGEVVVDDLVQGRVVYQNSELDDLIIIRSNGLPTYNFSVVVDEIEMGVTHVIRGDDHLNNTPRQINLFHALNEKLPQFGHVPLILTQSGRKVSKREDALSVLDYRDRGYLPEAVLNFLVRLGWSHGDQEIFTVSEMIQLFDVASINRSPASQDDKKLEWINHQHMTTGDPSRILTLAEQFFLEHGIDVHIAGPSLSDVFEVQKSRAKTLVEFSDKSKYFYQDLDGYDEAAAAKHLTSESSALLKQLISRLSELSEWTAAAIHGVFKDVVASNEVSFGALAQPVRVALTGGTVSPGIDVTVELMGRDETLERLENARRWIGRKDNS